LNVVSEEENEGSIENEQTENPYNECQYEFAESSSYAGGICGSNENSFIKDCSNEGEVTSWSLSTDEEINDENNEDESVSDTPDNKKTDDTMVSLVATSYAGGVCGHNSGEVVHCSNIGMISSESHAYSRAIGLIDDNVLFDESYNIASSSYGGGICGKNSGEISYCYNIGDVTGLHLDSDEMFLGRLSINAGGVSGYNSGTIEKSYNAGDILSSSTTSCSSNDFSFSRISGVCGVNDGGTIIYCYNAGDVSEQENHALIVYAGGICGLNLNNGLIINCYNTGNLYTGLKSRTGSSPAYYIGGICGKNDGGTISYCYNVGEVASYFSIASFSLESLSYYFIDGICGMNSGTINTCYVLDRYTSNHGIHLSDEKMKIATNYAGFDFGGVWDIASDVNDGYPHLRDMPTETETSPRITGPATIILRLGYENISSAKFTIRGTAPVLVTQDETYDDKVLWNNETKKLDIASGLSEGDYPITLTADNEIQPNAMFTVTLKVVIPPSISGPSEMLLDNGYSDTSTDQFSITGTNPITVTQNTDHGGKITWNDATKRIDIESGLPAGSYSVTLSASNGALPNANITFTLRVVSSPSLDGPSDMTLLAGYAATSTSVFFISGTEPVTITQDIDYQGKIRWDNTAKHLEIKEGLASGVYPVVLTASNGYAPNATYTFTLNVVTPAGIAGSGKLTLQEGYASTSTTGFTLTGTEPVTVTQDETHGDTILWNDVTKKLDISAGLSVGEYPVELTVSNGIGPDAGFVFTLSVVAEADSAFFPTIKLTPTHSILTDIDFTAAIEAAFAPDVYDYHNIAWSVENLREETNGSGIWGTGEPFEAWLNIDQVAGGKTIEVKATEEGLASKHTLRIRATYSVGENESYSSTATVELLPAYDGIVNPGDLLVSLLDTAVSVNKVKEVGALVPVRIERKDKPVNGLSALEVSAMVAGGVLSGASMIIEDVRLYTVSNKVRTYLTPVLPGGDPLPVGSKLAAANKRLSAAMSKTDDRFIEISAPMATKNATTNKVSVEVRIAGEWVQAGTTQIKVVETYPVIRASVSGPLNLSVVGGTPASTVPGSMAALTVTSPNGAVLDIKAEAVTKANNARVAYDYEGGYFKFGSKPGAKTGNVSMALSVQVEGYKEGFYPALAKRPRVNVNVAAVPKLKLSQTSINLLSDDALNDVLNKNEPEPPTYSETRAELQDVMIRALSGNKVPFDSGYEVVDVMPSDLNAAGRNVAVKGNSYSVTYEGGGWIRVSPGANCPVGTAALRVCFSGGTREVVLNFSFKRVQPAAITHKASPAATVASLTHADADTVTADVTGALSHKIVDVNITPSAANLLLKDLKIQRLNNVVFDPVADTRLNAEKTAKLHQTFDDAIGIEVSGHKISLYVKDRAELNKLAQQAKDTKYTLAIGTDKVLAGTKANAPVRTVNFTLTIPARNKSASFTLALGKEKLDIANEKSFVTATVKLANTTAIVQDVVLLNAEAAYKAGLNAQAFKDFNNSIITEEVLLEMIADNKSPYFRVQEDKVNGNAFRLEKIPGASVAPKYKYKVGAAAKLSNGEWVLISKAAQIAPVQGFTKNYKRAVTLYKAAPLTGIPVELNLTAPANVKMGQTLVTPGALAKLNLTKDGLIRYDAFTIDQSGATTWVVYLADGIYPQTLIPANIKTKRPALKKSYNVPVQIWAEGTYTLDPNTKLPAPIRDPKGKNPTKPTVVTITVNMK